MQIRAPEYHIRYNMLQRCYNPDHFLYKNYGGRGIAVCKRWRSSLKNFMTDMGPRPDKYTLERKNNDGNYEPSNCTWATRSQQANNKRNTIRITHNGETLTLREWSNKLNINYNTLYSRIIIKNNPIAEALNPLIINKHYTYKAHHITYQGEVYTVKELANKLNIKYGTLYYRLVTKKLSVDQATRKVI